jgi:hypothetical protein
MEKTLLPFRDATRQKVSRIDRQTLNAPNIEGAQVTMRLPKVGYLSRMWLYFEVTSTQAPVPQPSDFAIADIVSKVRVSLNAGRQVIVDASGTELLILQNLRRTSNDYKNGLAGNFIPNTTSVSFLVLEVPIAFSSGQNFHLGLINLQAPELECVLEVQFSPNFSNFLQNITVNQVTVEAHYEHYEAPDPRIAMQPPVALVKTLSESRTNLSGQVEYTLPRGGILLQYLEFSRDTSFPFGASQSNYSRIILNKTQTLYDMRFPLTNFFSDVETGKQWNFLAIQPSVIWYDFIDSYGYVGDGDLRDALDTEEITTIDFQSEYTISPVNVSYLRRILQVPVAS